jgi:integrase
MAKVTRQLFLSDYTGEPVSAQSIYEAWTTVTALPFKGWSPHLGRHYWACKKLIEGIEQRKKALDLQKDCVMSADWITGSAADDIELVIKPQLGHSGGSTTQRYLVWVQRAFTLTDMFDKYEAHLESLLAGEVVS